MRKDKQKYLFEIGLLQYTDNSSLLRPNDLIEEIYKGFLPGAKNNSDSTNLYFICKKPRLRFIKNSISINNNYLHIGFELSNKGLVKQRYVFLKNFNDYFPNAVNFTINKYSAARLDVLFSNNSTIGYPIEVIFTLIDAMQPMHEFTDKEICDYEILYIGQAFGKQGNNNALNRIKTHATLQRILSSLIDNEPYNEVFIMLFGLCSPKYIAMMNGEYCQDDYEDEGSSRLHLIKSLDIPRKQLMRIAEAALIRYFDPPYNKLLKNSFPSSNLKLLKECYNYDFNAIITEVNTEAINCFIYSQKVPTARNHHIAKFDLHSAEEELRFFQY